MKKKTTNCSAENVIETEWSDLVDFCDCTRLGFFFLFIEMKVKQVQIYLFDMIAARGVYSLEVEVVYFNALFLDLISRKLASGKGKDNAFCDTVQINPLLMLKVWI